MSEELSLILAALAAMDEEESKIRQAVTRLSGGGSNPPPPPAPIPPLYLSGEIGNVDASTVAITFDQDITIADATGVTIKVNSVAATISSATRQSNHAIVYFVLDTPAVSGDTVTWEYSGGTIAAEDDATPLETVTAQTVTNNISSEEDYMQRTVVLTNDQIKTLPTLPVEIVPAPGIGKYLVAPAASGSGLAVLQMHWVADYIGAGGSFQFGYGNFEDGIDASYGQDVALSFLNWDDANDALWSLAIADISSGASGPDYASVQENQSISLRIKDAPSGNFTGGDTGNSLKVTVFYNIVNL